MMPRGGALLPGTPSVMLKAKQTAKVVVALYPFKAARHCDVSLEEGAEYEVVDDFYAHWWRVKDGNGTVGYVPSNYVRDTQETLLLQKYKWYVGETSREETKSLLKQEDKEGHFMVRNSSIKGMYTLSLYTKVDVAQVKHYLIHRSSRGEFYISKNHCFSSIPELINYHQYNSAGLCSRLKEPSAAKLSQDKWMIHPSELVLKEKLGAGQFGVVRRGEWRGSIDVAVKMMKKTTTAADDFIAEAKIMTKLKHANLVNLHGVCSKNSRIFIVTEYMQHGSLLNYLRQTTPDQVGCTTLLGISIQVSRGMAYLERHNYIHRDLAARNCLVGNNNVVKVADFGLTRRVIDDQYTSSSCSNFALRWAPPEVLDYMRFSSKSDVWAFGVLMWEIFTYGEVPYGRIKNIDVVREVRKGKILDKPKRCPINAYVIMQACWKQTPKDRPSFRAIRETLALVEQRMLADLAESADLSESTDFAESAECDDRTPLL